MIKDIDSTVCAYISGFYDGEGCIQIHKKTLGLRTHIANTNLDILKRIKSVFKGEIYIKSEKSESYKQQWGWHIYNRIELNFLLETILQYSTVKKSQILDGLEFLEKTKSSMGKQLSYEERKYREYMYHKFKEPKHYLYTEEEIKWFDEQIKNTIQCQGKFDEFVYAYISGFFDAEGTIGAYEDKHNSLYLRTSISNTYPSILIGMKKVFGGNVTLHIKSNLNRRQSWIWRIGDIDDMKFFLTKILSYSIVKKPQIELGLKFLETDNYQTKLLIANKLKEMKDVEYIDEEMCLLNYQIKEMNIDKFQHTMEDY